MERQVGKMLCLEGHEQFPLPREELWKHLTDMDFLARTVPDLERVERSEPGVLVCRVRPGFSFLRGSLELTFETTRQQPSELAEMRIKSKGIGSSVSVLARLELKEEDASGSTAITQLRWTAQIEELGGLLKPISPDLIKAAAGRIVSQVWGKVREEFAKSPERDGH